MFDIGLALQLVIDLVNQSFFRDYLFSSQEDLEDGEHTHWFQHTVSGNYQFVGGGTRDREGLQRLPPSLE